jgi:hypothetical protein
VPPVKFSSSKSPLVFILENFLFPINQNITMGAFRVAGLESARRQAPRGFKLQINESEVLRFIANWLSLFGKTNLRATDIKISLVIRRQKKLPGILPIKHLEDRL